MKKQNIIPTDYPDYLKQRDINLRNTKCGWIAYLLQDWFSGDLNNYIVPFLAQISDNNLHTNLDADVVAMFADYTKCVRFVAANK